MSEILHVPDLGAFESVPVIEILVAPGDTVSAEAPLVTLESDKATMDVPAPGAGTVDEILVKVGDTVSAGSALLRWQPAAATNAPRPSIEPARPAPPTAPTSSTLVGASHSERTLASPAVRKIARELGVDIGVVSGTGRKSRVLKKDVSAYVRQVMHGNAPRPGAGMAPIPAAPPVDFSRFGPVALKPLPRIRRLSANRLANIWATVPQVTQFADADITDIEAFRRAEAEEAREAGVKLTLLPFLLKACVTALKRFPEVNSSLTTDGESLVLKQYFHVGVAVNTDEGLLVPVIRDVDKKGLFELARELAETAAAARAGTLKSDRLTGGCFSISSLGHVGAGDGAGAAALAGYFTPIVNAPEVAILGVSRATTRPIWQAETEGEGGHWQPRTMLPLSLSYDHRVIDGVQAAAFCVYLAGLLGDIRRLVL